MIEFEDVARASLDALERNEENGGKRNWQIGRHIYRRLLNSRQFNLSLFSGPSPSMFRERGYSSGRAQRHAEPFCSPHP